MDGFSEVVRVLIEKYRTPTAVVGGALLVFAAFLARVPEVGEGSRRDPTLAVASAPAPLKAKPSRSNLEHAVLAREETLVRRVDENPADAPARRDLARFYRNSHRPAAAIEHFEEYLTSNPDDRQVWLDLADCLAATGDWPRVQTVISDFLARWPDDPAGLYNMGAALANMGRRAEAREWWVRVRDQNRDPDLARTAATSLDRL